MRTRTWALVVLLFLGCSLLHAGVITYGDTDCLNQGCYGASDPTAGATLQGLAVNVISDSSTYFAHSWPFSPSGDFAGTDEIHVGTVQTANHDGYSGYSGRVNGPDVLVLDYSSLVGSGQSVTSLTLGIGADDFQYPVFAQPFSASVNGVANTALTNKLNSMNETTPLVHFFSIGLDPTVDNPTHTITLTLDEGGDGGDGYAVDFLTVGVTTKPTGTPEPASLTLLASALGGIAALRLRCSKSK